MFESSISPQAVLMRPALVLVAVAVLLVRAVERGIAKGVVAAVHLP